jgi:hypothetical protein
MDAAIQCKIPRALSLNIGMLTTPSISAGAMPAAGGEKWWRLNTFFLQKLISRAIVVTNNIEFQ